MNRADHAALSAAFTTIDDLRDLKVAQGREIARLNREWNRALDNNRVLLGTIDSLKHNIIHLKNMVAELEEAQRYDQMGDDL